jgi:PAS domain S-box-containing protein
MERFLKILIADNKEIIHQIIVDYLRDSGHSVDRFHDGDAVLAAIEEHEYDLALIDIRMPDMDELSLLNSILEIRSRMPVVVVTEYEDMDLALQALRLGAVDFLMKPVKLLELDAVLEKYLRVYSLIDRSMQGADEPTAMDCDEPQERKIAKRPVFSKLLLLICLLVPLVLIVSLFINRNHTAERMTAEELQVEVERRYRLLSDNIADVVWITDADLRTTYVNPAITNILGYDVAEVMTMPWEDIWAPECFEAIKKMFVEELAKKNIHQGTPNTLRTKKARLICRDGSAMWVEVKCTSLSNTDEKPFGLLVILHEITEDGQMEKLETSVDL